MDLSKAKWRTSSHSTGNGGDCVEVAAAALVAVRDSKDPHGPVLSFTAQRWAAFTDRLKTATRDLAPAAPAHRGSRVPHERGQAGPRHDPADHQVQGPGAGHQHGQHSLQYHLS